MIWVQCPNCGKWQEVNVSEVGKTNRECKQCAEWFTIIISTAKITDE